MVALFAQLARMLMDVLTHHLAISRTALLAAHRVQQQAGFRCGNANGLVEAHEHDDGLGVYRWLIGPQALNADLTELAQTALLRTLGAEHRASVHELRWGTALRNQVVLDNGANRACRAFRTQGKAAFRLQGLTGKQLFHVAAGNNREHLFGNNVGGLANATHEQIRLLEQRGFNGLIAATTENLERGLTEIVPKPHVIRKKIEGSLGCFHCHMLWLLTFEYSG